MKEDKPGTIKEREPIQLNLKKQPPKPPRGPNNYTQENERRARQAQHLNNKPKG